MKISKRIFDYTLASILLLLMGWVLVILLFISYYDTKRFGFFIQSRIGFKGKVFKIYKIRTMINEVCSLNNITSISYLRITKIGKILRKFKLDELPQLINIIKGDMSFVGPRPDIEGYADKLTGDDSVILSVRPGLTSPASIKYKNEEYLLSTIKDPQKYNDNIIWPDKVRMNKKYVLNWSFRKDLLILFRTIFKL